MAATLLDGILVNKKEQKSLWQIFYRVMIIFVDKLRAFGEVGVT